MKGDLVIIDNKICVILINSIDSITALTFEDSPKIVMYYHFEIDFLQKLSETIEIGMNSLICNQPEISSHNILIK